MKKKIGVIITILAMVVTLLAPYKTAYAGDGMDFSDIIYGLNQDGTVTAGASLSITMGDLNQKIPGFMSRYNSGKADVKWEIGNEDYSDMEFLSPTYDSGTFRFKVDKKYAGKLIAFSVDDPEMVNLGGERHLIVGDSSDEGGSGQGDSGQGGKSGMITILDGPVIASLAATTGIFKKNINLGISGRAMYYYDDEPSKTLYEDNITVKLFKNNKQIAKLTSTNKQFVFKNVPVSYKKSDNFKIQLFMVINGKEIAGPARSFTLKSDTLGKNRVVATKLSSKKVKLRWGGTTYAQGYYVYMGKKLVKKLGKKAFSKTYKNKVLNVSDSSSKKVVLKIKGKAGVDLANGSTSLSTIFDPVWD